MLILLNIKVTMSDPSNSNSGLSFLGLDVNLFETANATEYGHGPGYHAEPYRCSSTQGVGIRCPSGGSYCSPLIC